MKRASNLIATLAIFCAAPAAAHVGPEALERHFAEHLLIALVVGLPVGYALLRLLKRSARSGR